MHHDVKSMFQRPLNERCRKRIVADTQQAETPRDLRDCAQIDELEQRIVGVLTTPGGCWSNRLFQLRRLGQITNDTS